MSNGNNTKPKPAYCPNCSSPAVKTGNTIICEKCDAVFTITKQGTKVKSIGSIEDHENRLAALEKKTGLKQETAPEPEPSPVQESEEVEEVEEVEDEL